MTWYESRSQRLTAFLQYTPSRSQRLTAANELINILTSEMINSDKYKHAIRQYRTLPVVLDSIFGKAFL